MQQDYVVFARSRGISQRGVVFRYGLRNALIPCLTAGGLILGYMLTGAVLIEVTFALPGLGTLLVDSINFKDIPVLQALVMLVAVIMVLVNLGVDVLYQRVDPRIRFDSVA
jgi:peptide/nickel transport system permease protein